MRDTNCYVRMNKVDIWYISFSLFKFLGFSIHMGQGFLSVFSLFPETRNSNLFHQAWYAFTLESIILSQVQTGLTCNFFCSHLQAGGGRGGEDKVANLYWLLSCQNFMINIVQKWNVISSLSIDWSRDFHQRQRNLLYKFVGDCPVLLVTPATEFIWSDDFPLTYRLRKAILMTRK